jgi:hypothetical protein
LKEKLLVEESRMAAMQEDVHKMTVESVENDAVLKQLELENG